MHMRPCRYNHARLSHPIVLLSVPCLPSTAASNLQSRQQSPLGNYTKPAPMTSPISVN